MATTTVSSGTTRNSRLSMAGSDKLLVEAGATFSVSSNAQTVRFNGATDGAEIENNGVLENTASGGRAIRFEGPVGSTLKASITNTGTIKADDDALQIQDTAGVNSGQVSITNSGTLSSEKGQAVDFANGTGTFVTKINNSGDIFALINDAIRVGSVGNITNTGTITGGSSSANTQSADGIQFEDNATGTVTNTAGSISGDRHGINAGVGSKITVSNAAGAEITGRNGSGVGSDGSASVTNFGTITGQFTAGLDINGPAGGGVKDGIDDGDGDGIDIDGEASIFNGGVIQGLGASGHGSDGLPNTAEGIAAGGGSIYNGSNGVIFGTGLGILIDDSSQGNALFRTSITNSGVIEGKTSYGIKIVSDKGDYVSNSGTISGGNGVAILLGSGRDNLTIYEGSVINGLSDGGAGEDSLSFSPYKTSVTVNLATGEATGTGGVVNFENVFGGSADDKLTGNDVANTLDGREGADIMAGGKGNDVYYVDNAGDQVIEAAGEGRDIVYTSLNGYTLAANVEDLYITGNGAVNVTGNDLDNTIYGNSGRNVIVAGAGNDVIFSGGGDDWLDGGAGADLFFGGKGSTNFVFDDIGDRVTAEGADDPGTDTIWASVSVDMRQSGLGYIENLRLTGTDAIDATGNALNNLITGNAAANRIAGGAGNDNLYGKGGADVFAFSDMGAANRDSIWDFGSDDRVALDSRVFTGLAIEDGHLAAGSFVKGTAAVAAGKAVVIYNTSTGVLSYDADGKGGAAAQEIAFIGKNVPGFDQADISLFDGSLLVA